MAVTIPIKTPITKDAITADSAAIGPSSLARHRRIFAATFYILEFLLRYFQEPLIVPNGIEYQEASRNGLRDSWHNV